MLGLLQIANEAPKAGEAEARGPYFAEQQQLCAMGYSAAHAQLSLTRAAGDLPAAVDFLLQGVVVPEIAPPDSRQQPSAPPSLDELLAHPNKPQRQSIPDPDQMNQDNLWSSNTSQPRHATLKRKRQRAPSESGRPWLAELLEETQGLEPHVVQSIAHKAEVGMQQVQLLVDDGHGGAERLRNARPNEIIQRLRIAHRNASCKARADGMLIADRGDKLALGDYWWVAAAQRRVLGCVERKTVADLVSRSYCGSSGAAHSKQLRRLNNCGLQHVFFLLEGSTDVEKCTVYNAPLPGQREAGQQIDSKEALYCELGDLVLNTAAPTRLLETNDFTGSVLLLTAVSVVLSNQPVHASAPDFEQFSKQCRSQIQTLPRTVPLPRTQPVPLTGDCEMPVLSTTHDSPVGVAFLCVSGKLHVLRMQAQAFVEILSNAVMRHFGDAPLDLEGLGSCLTLRACRQAVREMRLLFQEFPECGGRVSQLCVVEGLLRQLRLHQGRASKAFQQGRELTSAEKLAMAGSVMNEVIALCQAVMVAEHQWHVKLVENDKDANLFLNIIDAKLKSGNATPEELEVVVLS